MNNNYNTPAFTANFAVRNVRLNPSKLKAVQSRFSQLTEHYKHDTLTVMPKMVSGSEIGEQGMHFRVADFYTNKSNSASIVFLKDFKEWFGVGSVEEISKALSRIFKAGKFNEIQEGKIGRLRRNLKYAVIAANRNSAKAKLSHDPIYSVVAASNRARAAALKKELEKAQNYRDQVQYRIQDYPIDAPIQWRYE